MQRKTREYFVDLKIDQHRTDLQPFFKFTLYKNELV